jgi:hypothetical protein
VVEDEPSRGTAAEEPVTTDPGSSSGSTESVITLRRATPAAPGGVPVAMSTAALAGPAAVTAGGPGAGGVAGRAATGRSGRLGEDDTPAAAGAGSRRPTSGDTGDGSEPGKRTGQAVRAKRPAVEPAVGPGIDEGIRRSRAGCGDDRARGNVPARRPTSTVTGSEPTATPGAPATTGSPAGVSGWPGAEPAAGGGPPVAEPAALGDVDRAKPASPSDTRAPGSWRRRSGSTVAPTDEALTSTGPAGTIAAATLGGESPVAGDGDEPA